MPNFDVKTLLTLADLFLASAEQESSDLNHLQNYVNAFQTWQVNINAEVESAKNDSLLREQLEALSEKHSQVLTRSSELKENALDDLKSFRTRSRALLAYADTLPKRISSRPGKKG